MTEQHINKRCYETGELFRMIERLREEVSGYDDMSKRVKQYIENTQDIIQIETLYRIKKFYGKDIALIGDIRCVV